MNQNISLCATEDESRLDIVQCPMEVSYQDLKGGKPRLFLAGGITGCPNWQNDFATLLSDEELIVFNPKRAVWPIDCPESTYTQVSWEHAYLNTAEAVSFWMPKATDCPITLFELGFWAQRAKPVFVGMEPGYSKKNEILTRLRIVRTNTPVVDNLVDLAKNVKAWLHNKAQTSFASQAPVIKQNSVYLAGGIRGCPDWQKDFSDILATNTQLLVNNPRRADYVEGDLNYERMLAYENHLSFLSSQIHCIWFPKETVGPIALFELGMAAAMAHKPLFVGVHPEYPRKEDIEVQLRLALPHIRIASSLHELASQLIGFARNM